MRKKGRPWWWHGLNYLGLLGIVALSFWWGYSAGKHDGRFQERVERSLSMKSTTGLNRYLKIAEDMGDDDTLYLLNAAGCIREDWRERLWAWRHRLQVIDEEMKYLGDIKRGRRPILKARGPDGKWTYPMPATPTPEPMPPDDEEPTEVEVR